MLFRQPAVDDWAIYRDFRIAGLTESPLAFGETSSAARACTPDQWRQRLKRMQPPDFGVVAVDDTGQWVGLMRADRALGPAWLYGVYVMPECRGSGVADALMRRVIDWVLDGVLYLHVAQSNPRAARFYTRHGFVATGATADNPAHPGVVEVEMRRRCGSVE